MGHGGDESTLKWGGAGTDPQPLALRVHEGQTTRIEAGSSKPECDSIVMALLRNDVLAHVHVQHNHTPRLTTTQMKTRSLFSALAFAIAALVVTVGAVTAQPRHGCPDGCGEGRGHKGLQRLNLTDQQKEKIKSLRDAFKTQYASSIQEIKSLRDQMRDKRQDGDKEGAQAIREQLKTKHETMKPAHEKLHQDIMSVLTQEQRDQLAKMKEERRDRRRDHRRGHGRPGQGPPADMDSDRQGIE